ncbi:retrotransposon protein, putative, ty1-copia subclass [Tanacetum coccineum]
MDRPAPSPDHKSCTAPSARYPKEKMDYYFNFPPENKIVVSSKVPMKVGFELSQEEVIPILRSARTHQALDRLCLNVEVEEHSLGDLNEPTNYKAAILDSESDKIMHDSKTFNNVFYALKEDLIYATEFKIQEMAMGGRENLKKVKDASPSKITSKIVMEVEGFELPHEKISPIRSSSCSKGFTQTYGIDYEETFSPVAKIRATRIVIVIAVFYDYEICQMDVKTAFLNGYLDEDIYMIQPEGFIDPIHPRKVCKLQRSIYGLKQASRSWNKRFDEEIKRECSVAKWFPMLQCRSIMFVILGELHWTAVKTILKYLRNTKDMFLVYGGNPEAELRVDCYCDAGFETDRDDTKS